MKSGAARKKLSVFLFGAVCLFSAAFFAACSFDYGDGDEADTSKPDIVMENIEYVRVRDGAPIARFQAEYAERWEDRQTMELKNFSFEQLEDNGETVNAEGKAGAAEVQLGSGNISLKSGVTVTIDSEDITIKTAGLDWKDKEKTLSGGDGAEVDIERSDGTSFSGRGFSADIRGRTWNFTGEVTGRYVEEEAGDGAEEIEPGAAEAGEDKKDAEKESPPPETEPEVKAPVSGPPPEWEEK